MNERHFLRSEVGSGSYWQVAELDLAVSLIIKEGSIGEKSEV